MTPDDLKNAQAMLGLSDNKLAAAIGVTRQSVRNWRNGGSFPVFAQNALRWMMALRAADPANDNLPETVKVRL